MVDRILLLDNYGIVIGKLAYPQGWGDYGAGLRKFGLIIA